MTKTEIEKSGNFLQSEIWSAVNRQIGHTPILEKIAGFSVLMIVKNAKRGRYLEIPGGPLIDWTDTAVRQQVFARIRAVARENHCVFVRFRPQLANTPEDQAYLQDIGAVPAPFHLYAEHTVVVDLSPDEDTLLANMRRQTRYEVRRAAKLGLSVSHDNSEETFRKFHKIQSDTAARQHFIPPTMKELLAYRECFGNDAQIYTAKQGSEIVAMGLILNYGVEADYFEAASTDLNRKLPGAYTLLWHAICDAKKQGKARFNLWGIAPPGQPHHRYAGVTTFKTGFGGDVTEYIPAQDIVINKIKYQKVKLIETVRKKRRHL